jgi:trimeric autotransporter adhesin
MSSTSRCSRSDSCIRFTSTSRARVSLFCRTVRLAEIIFALLVLVAVHGVLAQSQAEVSRPASAVPSVPVSSILQADGSVDLSKGFSGTLDVKGWHMTTDPSGAPKFVRAPATKSSRSVDSYVGPEADPDNKYWDDQFDGLAGTDGYLYSAVVTTSGKLIVGGQYVTEAGPSLVQNIAQWDGRTWSSLGSGVDGLVWALAVSGNDVYVGGDFTVAGGLAANGIARWDGSVWHALGAGLGVASGTARVFSIAVTGGDVYAAGVFSTAGGASANNIARWNGSSWSGLGAGLNAAVCDLAMSGTTLYAGGDFTTAGVVAAKRIAKWDGSTWSALGTGMNGRVWTLAVMGGDLYAGGSFTSAGTAGTARIARWNGSSWSSVGGGVSGDVNDLVVMGGTLCAAVQGGGVRMLIGSSWSSLGSVWYNAYALAVGPSGLYAVGSIQTIGGASVHNVALWDGTSWKRLGSGMGLDAGARTLAVIGRDLYVGGEFSNAGGTPVSYIARWDGSAWHPLGTGLNSYPCALAVKGNDLYAAGWFTTAGGSSAKCVARWDGSNWYPLGSGLSGDTLRPFPYADCLSVIGNDLYVGGTFSFAGGVQACSVARWDGSNWHALGTGLDSTRGPLVWDMAVRGTELFVGGLGVSLPGSTNNEEVLKWDGATWSLVGATDGQVEALEVMADQLYVGGRFSIAGGVSANNIARWNGSAWYALGSGTNGQVCALATMGGTLYVCGQFATAGGATANCIAMWRDGTWSALGSGLGDSSASALAVHGNSLFVGGQFVAAGGKVSRHIAVWQPRVNLTADTMSAAPAGAVIGGDPYGFHRPALTTGIGTNVIYSGGLPTTTTVDRAREIHVSGQRVNGAFTLLPEGMQFGGTGATLQVEFSEDDVAAYPGTTYADFRAVRLTYPSDYPANKEAAAREGMAGQSAPTPVRIDNGKQIYAITVPIIQITSTYGAVPQPFASVGEWQKY